MALLAFVVFLTVWFFAHRFLVVATVSYETSVAPVSASGRSLSVGGFNIAHARGGQLGQGNWAQSTKQDLHIHLTNIARQIREADLDIVVLNEVDFDSAWSHSVNQARYIAKEAGYAFVVEQRNMDVGFPFYRFAFGNAILSRYPVIESEFVDFEPHSVLEDIVVGNHDGIMTTLETPVGPVHVFAVHFEYRSEDVRLQAATRIADMANASNCPTLAIGDFNSAPLGYRRAKQAQSGGNAMTHLLGPGGFQASPKVADSAQYATFPSEKPDRVIDWILKKGPLNFVSAGVVRSRLSDHFMITAVLAAKSDADDGWGLTRCSHNP